jgi:hypothetical protein
VYRALGADRRELDRFFGAESFRERWKAYVPCAGRNWTTEVFEITFADVSPSPGRLIPATAIPALASAATRARARPSPPSATIS